MTITRGDLYMAVAGAPVTYIWQMSMDVLNNIRLMEDFAGELVHWPHPEHVWCIGVPVKLTEGKDICRMVRQ